MKDYRSIKDALNELQQACGFGRSESGTEALFGVLSEAIFRVDRADVEESYANGLCCDVNAMLAGEIEKLLAEKPEQS
jgi:hypothetical protein